MRPRPAGTPPNSDADSRTTQLEFGDNALLANLFGQRDRHLQIIETQLGVSALPRGNLLALSGPASSVDRARAVLNALYQRLASGQTVTTGDVEAAIRLTTVSSGIESAAAAPPAIKTRKRQISARTQAQTEYIHALRDNPLVFGVGPAGTGKTYLAVATAVDLMMAGEVNRIILSRPAVEAGERLGFLPGDMKEKVDPYLRPLYDALNDMLPADQIAKRLANGDIEVAPLAFMRGRTLAHAFVILDEAQNTTQVQMKMFLTRLGEGSRMAITGDLTQIDLPKGIPSGLADALDVIEGTEGVKIIRFSETDVVRHPLVARIVQAYEKRDRRRAETLTGHSSRESSSHD